MNDEAARIVQRLHLAPLPHEGGFFRRTWTAPSPADRARPAASAILFLLTSSDFSAFHRLTSEEVWFFQAGDPLEHAQLIPGQSRPLITTLHSPAVDPHAASQAPATPQSPRSRSPLSRGVPEGRGVDASPTVVIPPGIWQGARIAPAASSHGWSLVSCVVTPAWSDDDFTLGDRAALLHEFPGARDWIAALTR